LLGKKVNSLSQNIQLYSKCSLRNYLFTNKVVATKHTSYTTHKVHYSQVSRVSGPTVWNSLPQNLRSSDISREQFKHGLDWL